MLIRVHVIPNSKEERITQLQTDSFKVFIKEPPANNIANEKVFELLKNFFPTSRILLVNGHHKEHKTFNII